MKYSLYLLLTLVVLFCSADSVQAGFRMKKHIANESVVTTKSSTNSAVQHVTKHERRSHLFNTIKQVTYPFTAYYRRRPTEWVGIAALFFGVLGLFVPGLDFLALLFGVLGMGRHCRTNGLAVAGFVMGLLELLLYLIFGTMFLSLILL